MPRKYAQQVVELPSAECDGSTMKNMSRIRESRGLTQSQLAESIGANQATISKIEKGVGNPTLEMIVRIANALRVSPSDLFDRDILEQRVLNAMHRLTDDHAREAAATVLEAMAQNARKD